MEVLLYALEQGPVEKTILLQCMMEGLEIPEAMANAPELANGLELYYYAYGDLVSSRPVGLGMGPISWSTIQEYCDHHGLDSEQTEAMHYHVGMMDAEFLEFHKRKTPGKGKR